MKADQRQTDSIAHHQRAAWCGGVEGQWCGGGGRGGIYYNRKFDYDFDLDTTLLP